MSLIIKDLHVSVDNKKILNGINIEVNRNEINALMGPNGAGKSSLAFVLMGHPKYKIESGSIILNNEDITKMKPNERAKKGLFLSFQHPSEISGISVSNFLRTILNSKRSKPISVMEFKKLLDQKMNLLKIDNSFANRYLNEGFSGGEKKRTEILQMAILEPEIAILDEVDSGTDIDALKTIANGINIIKTNTGVGCLLITHYNRILKYVKPDKVYILIDGKIVKTGNAKLADEIEEKGYNSIM